MGNQQDYLLSNNQIQVLLTGSFGDGSITRISENSSRYTTNNINKEYIEFKSKLLENLFESNINEYINKGFKKSKIYSLHTKSCKNIMNLHNLSIDKKLNLLDDLGLALWFYDDGSKHNKQNFYNLNTHSFSKNEHTEYLIPFFEKRGLFPTLFKDKKKDGRIFSYLYFSPYKGGFEIAKILEKYPINCYLYKRWSSETIQKWSKLQVQLKNENKTVSSHMFANMLKNIVL